MEWTKTHLLSFGAHERTGKLALLSIGVENEFPFELLGILYSRVDHLPALTVEPMADLSVPEVAMVSGHKTPAMPFRYTHPKAEAVASPTVAVDDKDGHILIV